MLLVNDMLTGPMNRLTLQSSTALKNDCMLGTALAVIVPYLPRQSWLRLIDVDYNNKRGCQPAPGHLLLFLSAVHITESSDQ